MKSIRTILFVVLLSTVVLVGCGNNSTPGKPPAIPTVSGLPEGEPTLPANPPVGGYPAPEQIVVPTTDPAGAYPEPLDPSAYPSPPVDPNAYPAPAQ